MNTTRKAKKSHHPEKVVALFSAGEKRKRASVFGFLKMIHFQLIKPMNFSRRRLKSCSDLRIGLQGVFFRDMEHPFPISEQ